MPTVELIHVSKAYGRGNRAVNDVSLSIEDGEFLVLVCGFDIGYLEITMTLLLLAVAVYTVLGGMLSVLVTDFLQFVVMSAGLIVVTILIIWNVGWASCFRELTSRWRSKPTAATEPRAA